MTDLEKTNREYFAWDPHDDAEFAPTIFGSGTIGGKGRSLLFALRKLRDSGDPQLCSSKVPESIYFSIDIFHQFLAVAHLLYKAQVFFKSLLYYFHHKPRLPSHQIIFNMPGFISFGFFIAILDFNLPAAEIMCIAPILLKNAAITQIVPINKS